MKNKKYLTITIIILIFLLFVVFIMSKNKTRTIDGLINQLESALNKHNIEMIVELYPDFYRNTIRQYLSQAKIDEFYNKIILNDDKIQIEILYASTYDLSEAKGVQSSINQEYNTNINVQDYQFVIIKYHEDFGESTIEVVKIENNYYLYPRNSYIPEPIQYFIVD